MDALAASALSYGYNEGPKLVCFNSFGFFFLSFCLLVGMYRIKTIVRFKDC